MNWDKVEEESEYFSKGRYDGWNLESWDEVYRRSSKDLRMKKTEKMWKIIFSR